MSGQFLEEVIRGEFEWADRVSRRRGRRALRRMVRTGVINESDLMNVAAPKPGYRKSIQHLTVRELIDMGIVAVVPSD